MTEKTSIMVVLLADQNFVSTAVCFSLHRATLLACFPADSTNF